MKSIKKIKNVKMSNAKNEKARTTLSQVGKKAVSGCPELNFGPQSSSK